MAEQPIDVTENSNEFNAFQGARNTVLRNWKNDESNADQKAVWEKLDLSNSDNNAKQPFQVKDREALTKEITKANTLKTEFDAHVTQHLRTDK